MTEPNTNYDPAEFYRLNDAPDWKCRICGAEPPFCTCNDDEPSLDLGDCAEQMREGPFGSLVASASGEMRADE